MEGTLQVRIASTGLKADFFTQAICAELRQLGGKFRAMQLSFDDKPWRRFARARREGSAVIFISPLFFCGHPVEESTILKSLYITRLCGTIDMTFQHAFFSRARWQGAFYDDILFFTFSMRWQVRASAR